MRFCFIGKDIRICYNIGHFLTFFTETIIIEQHNFHNYKIRMRIKIKRRQQKQIGTNILKDNYVLQRCQASPKYLNIALVLLLIAVLGDSGLISQPNK